MCRIMAIIPGEGMFVDADILRKFGTLASNGRVIEGKRRKGHRDGWGIVSWKDGLPFYLGREPNDASSDSKFLAACDLVEKRALSTPVIAHLRRSSSGAKTEENTHPFIRGEWAFAHNGTIRRLNLKKETDSEWFFRRLMEEYETRGGDIQDAIRKEAPEVGRIYPYSSLTFVLSDGEQVYAYRDCREHEEYYTMMYAKIHGCLVICQEEILEGDWHALSNGELLSVQAKDLSLSITRKSTVLNPSLGS